MAFKRLLSGDPAKTSKLYLGIGILSLVKAIAVRDDRNRFRRELLDAGLFIGIGVALRRYSQLKAEKRTEIEESVPDWVVGVAESDAAKQGIRSVAKQQLGREPEPEPSIRDRARGLVSSS